jgi:hypothetical protein
MSVNNVLPICGISSKDELCDDHMGCGKTQEETGDMSMKCKVSIYDCQLQISLGKCYLYASINMTFITFVDLSTKCKIFILCFLMFQTYLMVSHNFHFPTFIFSCPVPSQTMEWGLSVAPDISNTLWFSKYWELLIQQHSNTSQKTCRFSNRFLRTY